MESSFKIRSVGISIISGVICVFFAPTIKAENIIYNNSNHSGYVAQVGSAIEIIDYGTTANGGVVKSFTLGFAADTFDPGSVKVRFYQGTDYYSSGRSNLLAAFQVNLPDISDTSLLYEHEYNILSNQQFHLASGSFGYSLEFSSDKAYPVLASGGAGNEDYLWMYVQDPWDWSWYWERVRPNWPENGFYMKIYADPVEYCSFSGNVYEDLNQDGQLHPAEPLLKGWRIFVDQNDNRIYDTGEPNDITDTNGYYTISNVPISSFRALCQQAKDGWKPVNPETGFYQPWVSADQNYTLNFGNKQHGHATISGYKFEDADANGSWENDEPAIEGWRIYIDKNNNSQWDPTEPNDLTDPNGFYELTNLDAPADLILAEEMQTGWNQTFPGGSRTYFVSTEPNTIYENHNFGNTTLPVDVKISGYVRLSNAAGLEGVLLEAYENSITPTGNTDISDNNGYYEIFVPSGWSGTIKRSKEGWMFNAALQYENIITDMTENISAYWPYSGGLGSESSPFKISTVEDLLNLGQKTQDYNKHFILTNDIDLAGTITSGAIIAPNTGAYSPLADFWFSGHFDGAGFSILNLTGNSGLFGYIRNAVIKNLGVENVNIVDADSPGAICNDNHGGTIENCFSTGNISAFHDAGGICGLVHTEYLEEQLAGVTLPPVNTPAIKNCYSTVNIIINKPEIMHYPAMHSAGGLCAYAEGAEIINNYAAGNVDATGNWFSSGNVIIDNGGLIGHIKNSIVHNNYSCGHIVNGNDYSNPGGFCGKVSGSLSSFSGNFWDILTSSQLNSACGDGLTTDQMKSYSFLTASGWSFDDNAWRICDGFNYPRLAWQEYVSGDIACPDGVGMEDFSELASQWMTAGLCSADIAPDGGDGKVNTLDLKLISENWLLGR